MRKVILLKISGSNSDLPVDGAFEGRFRISSETWNDALSDQGSPMYRAMSARILEELKKIYSDDDLNVTIFGFEAGSVIVKFRWLENERGGFICKFTFRRHTGSSKIKGAKLGEGSSVRANLLWINQ